MSSRIKGSLSVHVSDSISDIIGVNRRSVYAKDRIRIIELSTLSNIIPTATAESIRKGLLRRKVKVMQLTNQRTFEPWTKVKDFIKECMSVRYVPKEILPIKTEVLIFDDVVAIYQIEPDISVTIIEHSAFAEQQKALFDRFWEIATPATIGNDGSTTRAVTIKRTPAEVYDYVSNLANWPDFSDFAANFERVNNNEYIAHTPQGDIRVVAIFDRKRLLLDTKCVLPDGEVQTIPYRVVPNKDGAELIMTNFKPASSTKAGYEEQLRWMEIELQRIKEILEKKSLNTKN